MKKVQKKQCADCKFREVNCIYREICTAVDDSILSDEVINWIKQVGCASFVEFM